MQENHYLTLTRTQRGSRIRETTWRKNTVKTFRYRRRDDAQSRAARGDGGADAT